MIHKLNPWKPEVEINYNPHAPSHQFFARDIGILEGDIIIGGTLEFLVISSATDSGGLTTGLCKEKA